MPKSYGKYSFQNPVMPFLIFQLPGLYGKGGTRVVSNWCDSISVACALSCGLNLNCICDFFAIESDFSLCQKNKIKDELNLNVNELHLGYLNI